MTDTTPKHKTADMKAYQRAYYEAHKEERRAKARAYYEAHKESHKKERKASVKTYDATTAKAKEVLARMREEMAKGATWLEAIRIVKPDAYFPPKRI